MDWRHILFYLLVIVQIIQGAVITVPLPVSVTVPPNTTARFTCEGNGVELTWLIKTGLVIQTLTPDIQQQRGITFTNPGGPGDLSSVLNITGLPANDGVELTCQVFSFQPFEQAVSGGTLKIRDVSPVQNLTINFISNNSIEITWSPPVYWFPPDLPVTYQVLVTDEEDGDIILNKTIPDTNIEVANVTECDTFTISVAALVDQYTPNNNDTARTNNGSYYLTVDKKLQRSVSIEVSSMPLPYCEKKLFVKDKSDGSVLVDEILSVDLRNVTLDPFKKYQLLTEVKNLRDKVKDTKYTNISTYNVQDVLVSTEGNGSVSVQCVFVSGSTADGCHVTFTDTSNGMVINVSLPLVQEPTLVALRAGNYTVSVYDIINGSSYGPAVYYPTLVEIIKIMPSTSSSTHESMSSTASSEVILTPTSSTTIATLGTVATSSTSETINDTNYVVPIVAGTVSVIVLMILIVLATCVSIPVYKRKKNIIEAFLRSEFATTQKPQAESNQYQDAQELRNEVPITTGSPVQLTYSRPIDEENPYHVTRSEFLPDNHTIPDVEGLMQHEPRPSITSMATVTTQDTILEDSISSITLNNIHADPTYASIAKRTDATPLPAVDQRVEYDTVTGDINKKGDFTLYHENNNSGFVIGDEVADLPEIPPPLYDDLDTITDPVIEPSTESNTVSSQAVQKDYFYSQAKEVSQMDGATTLCVSSPVEQPKNETNLDRQLKNLNDANPKSTPLPAPFCHQPQGDNNSTCIAALEDDDLLLFDDDYGLTTMIPEKINNDMIIVSRAASLLLGIKEEANVEVLASSFDDENKEKQVLPKREEKSEESSKVIEEENAPNSTCQSALQILLKYGIPIALLLVTVAAALLFSHCNDGGNHTEMVPLLAQHHYNIILDLMEEEQDTMDHDYEYLTVQKDDDANIMMVIVMDIHWYGITMRDMDYSYNIDIPGVNEAREGELLEQTVSFENFIYFEIYLFLLKDESSFIFNESAYAFHLDSNFKPEGSKFSLGYTYTLNDDIPNEDLDFLFPVKTSYNDNIGELLTSIRGDRRWITRNCFKPLKFDTKARREDDHSGNSIDDINKPRRGFKWWILVIIYVFFFSGTVLCVNLLMRDNTDIGAFLNVYYMILIWTSKKLKKSFRNKVHLAELMEGLMRSFYQDTCCFTITKMISQITITFQKENWKLLEGPYAYCYNSY